MNPEKCAAPLSNGVAHTHNSRLRGLAQDGQAMVEMALVLPVLLLVVTGILTFGLAFNNYILLTEATSVGARTLAISRGGTTDPAPPLLPPCTRRRRCSFQQISPSPLFSTARPIRAHRVTAEAAPPARQET